MGEGEEGEDRGEKSQRQSEVRVAVLRKAGVPSWWMPCRRGYVRVGGGGGGDTTLVSGSSAPSYVAVTSQHRNMGGDNRKRGGERLLARLIDSMSVYYDTTMMVTCFKHLPVAWQLSSTVHNVYWRIDWLNQLWAALWESLLGPRHLNATFGCLVLLAPLSRHPRLVKLWNLFRWNIPKIMNWSQLCQRTPTIVELLQKLGTSLRAVTTCLN